jgi:hypothetical protein
MTKIEDLDKEIKQLRERLRGTKMDFKNVIEKEALGKDSFKGKERELIRENKSME